jgi:hypothetical protein
MTEAEECHQKRILAGIRAELLSSLEGMTTEKRRFLLVFCGCLLLTGYPSWCILSPVCLISCQPSLFILAKQALVAFVFVYSLLGSGNLFHVALSKAKQPTF